MSGRAAWTIVEWFGEIHGVRNSGEGYAEDVTVMDGSAMLVDVCQIAPQETVTFIVDATEVSISWLDSGGIHADVIRLES